MNMKYLHYNFFALLPTFVFAASIDSVTEAEGWALSVLMRLNYFFWLLAILVFVWGIVKFIFNANDTVEREKGKQLMIGGIIAFFVLVSLWGIVAFVLVDTFGINSAPVQYIDKNGVAY